MDKSKNSDEDAQRSSLAAGEPPPKTGHNLHLPAQLGHRLGWDRARVIGRLFLLSALVGVVAGIGAVLFHLVLDATTHFFLTDLAGIDPGKALGEGESLSERVQNINRWWLFFLPSLGGLASGIIIYTFAPETEGHGTDAAIDSYHNRGGKVRARVPLVKAITSALTMGTGGSAGREGPIAQIGAGFGSLLSGWMHLGSRERRIMMAAGMGAGIGAIFQAPLAGALFASEVMYREMDMEHEVITPAIIASIVAFSVFSLFFGWEPLFAIPDFTFTNPAQLLPYTILALVVAFGGMSFVITFEKVHTFFAGLKIPLHFRPAIGGLVVGAIAMVAPRALGSSYGVLQDAFLNHASIGLLLGVGVAKIFATSFTISSGGSGGVFGPAVVIGGALGGAAGLAMQQVFPGMGIEPGAFAMVGMAGFFSAVANTPISTIIMVSEMTGNYHLLVPSMWVAVMSFLLVRKLGIYSTQVRTRADAPYHMREIMRRLRQRLSVRDILHAVPHQVPLHIAPQASLHEVLRQFSETEDTCLPVVKEGKIAGAVHLDSVQKILDAQGELDSLLIAQDLSVIVPTVHPENSYEEVQNLLSLGGHDALIVVESKGSDKVIAVLRAADVSASLNKLVADRSTENIAAW